MAQAQKSTQAPFLKSDDSAPSHEQPIVHSTRAVVASEDRRCSDIGVSILQKGGHAVDAAIATSLGIGVVSQMWCGIGGGDFMVIHSVWESASVPSTIAIDSRETAPAAASENMYAHDPKTKSKGPLSVAVPGKVAGLHAAWKRYGKLPWKTLFEPAIELARKGFEITKFQAESLLCRKDIILADPGLQKVYAPHRILLKEGEMCYNPDLANTMEEIAEKGPEAFYDGDIGKKLVEKLAQGGGIITLDDLRKYKVRITDALKVDTMGYTIYGMPPPSAGTVGLAMLLNILQSYKSPDAFEHKLGLHRMIEGLKHMFAIRLGLGDPAFEDITDTVNRMLSPEYAEKICERIVDTTTFAPFYYLMEFNQQKEHGTSHLIVVDEQRNVVSLTSSVNDDFGSGILCPSTGIVLNNTMDDFSIPTDDDQHKLPPKLPPAPTNFIKPHKRPLSSMTPIIIFKDNQLIGALGGSGGLTITPGVIQVFLNRFISGMDPLAAMKDARVYHRLIPNIVFYEKWIDVYGDHIELSPEKQKFLKSRGHVLKDVPFILDVDEQPIYDLREEGGVAAGAYCQLVVQDNVINKGNETLHGMLTAVSDSRKGGFPAAL